MPTLNVSFTSSWHSHDAWTETYLGVHRLLYQILPESSAAQRAEDGALSQLALIGANHLMEVALSKLLLPFVDQSTSTFSIKERDFEYASYYRMLHEWTPKVTGQFIDFTKEPFSSVYLLRRKRNGVTHKSSDVVPAEMARCALFSAVSGSQALFGLFDIRFPHSYWLGEYPLDNDRAFLRYCIERMRIGYSEGKFETSRYGLNLEQFNDGKSYKLYAEELGGKDVVSANFYASDNSFQIKPCEMPVQKVLDFLSGFAIAPDS